MTKRCENCNNWNLITGNCRVFNREMKGYERCNSSWKKLEHDYTDWGDVE